MEAQFPFVLQLFQSDALQHLSSFQTKYLDVLRHKILLATPADSDPATSSPGYFFWNELDQRVYQVPVDVTNEAEDDNVSTGDHSEAAYSSSSAPTSLEIDQGLAFLGGRAQPLQMGHTILGPPYHVRVSVGGYLHSGSHQSSSRGRGKRRAIPFDDPGLVPLTEARLGIDTASVHSWIFATEVNEYPPQEDGRVVPRANLYPLGRHHSRKSEFAEISGPESFEVTSSEPDATIVGHIVEDLVSVTSPGETSMLFGLAKFGIVNYATPLWLDCGLCDGILGLSSGLLPWSDSDPEKEEGSVSLFAQKYLSTLVPVGSPPYDNDALLGRSHPDPGLYIEIDFPLSSESDPDGRTGGRLVVDVKPYPEQFMIRSSTIPGCTAHHPLLVLRSMEWGFTQNRMEMAGNAEINVKCFLDPGAYNCALPPEKLADLFQGLSDSIEDTRSDVVGALDDGYGWLQGAKTPLWLRLVLSTEVTSEECIYLEIPGDILSDSRAVIPREASPAYHPTPFISSGSAFRSSDGRAFSAEEVGGIIGVHFLSWGKLCIYSQPDEVGTMHVGLRPFEEKYSLKPIPSLEGDALVDPTYPEDSLANLSLQEHTPTIVAASHSELSHEHIINVGTWHQLPTVQRHKSDSRSPDISSPWYQTPMWSPDVSSPSHTTDSDTHWPQLPPPPPPPAPLEVSPPPDAPGTIRRWMKSFSLGPRPTQAPRGTLSHQSHHSSHHHNKYPSGSQVPHPISMRRSYSTDTTPEAHRIAKASEHHRSSKKGKAVLSGTRGHRHGGYPEQGSPVYYPVSPTTLPNTRRSNSSKYAPPPPPPSSDPFPPLFSQPSYPPFSGPKGYPHFFLPEDGGRPPPFLFPSSKPHRSSTFNGQEQRWS